MGIVVLLLTIPHYSSRISATLIYFGFIGFSSYSNPQSQLPHPNPHPQLPHLPHFLNKLYKLPPRLYLDLLPSPPQPFLPHFHSSRFSATIPSTYPHHSPDTVIKSYDELPARVTEAHFMISFHIPNTQSPPGRVHELSFLKLSRGNIRYQFASQVGS